VVLPVFAGSSTLLSRRGELQQTAGEFQPRSSKLTGPRSLAIAPCAARTVLRMVPASESPPQLPATEAGQPSPDAKPHDSAPRFRVTALLCSAACGITVVAAIALGAFLLEQTQLERSVKDQSDSRTDPVHVRYRQAQATAHRQGIDQPRFVVASKTYVPDHEECVVVNVDDTHYAFPLSLLSNIKTHVINCQLEGQHLAVTYCDLQDTTRVFKSSNPSEPLTASATRFDGTRRGMMLQINGEAYHQMSPEIPLADLPFQRVTWGQWKADHPDTRVLVISTEPDDSRVTLPGAEIPEKRSGR